MPLPLDDTPPTNVPAPQALVLARNVHHAGYRVRRTVYPLPTTSEPDSDILQFGSYSDILLSDIRRPQTPRRTGTDANAHTRNGGAGPSALTLPPARPSTACRAPLQHRPPRSGPPPRRRLPFLLPGARTADPLPMRASHHTPNTTNNNIAPPSFCSPPPAARATAAFRP